MRIVRLIEDLKIRKLIILNKIIIAWALNNLTLKYK
jgi:hypothetical protein